MEKIKVGDYVRTNKGNIGRVIGIFNGHCTAKYHIEFKGNVKVKRQYLSTNTIVKHSKIISEVVEVGDYVNGSKLISIDYAEDEFGNCDKLHFYFHFEDDEKDVNEYYDKLVIKSIATKEQFSQIEYIMED